MELRIKLETYKDKLEISPLSEAECRISINPENLDFDKNPIFQNILIHLCQVITEHSRADHDNWK